MANGEKVSIMDDIETPAERAVIATLCGDSGMGKTSLAAIFPKPIFIRAEDGLQAIPAAHRPQAFPLVQTTKRLWEQLTAIIHEPHDYKTLVIDSVTALERLFIAEVMEMDGKAKSINQALGGYGAGTSAVAAMHQRVRKAAGLANEKRGMHIIFCAHVDVETIKAPDNDDYMRYILRMGAKSMPPYVDDVDLVGFIRLQMFTKGEDGDRKKAISTGERELICHAVASNVSKNRFGISEALAVPFDQATKRVTENPLVPFIPSLQTANTKPKQQKEEG